MGTTVARDEPTRTAPMAALDEEQVVQPGDRVLISYVDEPSRQYMLTLSTTRHDPDAFIIKESMPLAQALMGYGKDDEVEIPAGGATRRVTIVDIERSMSRRASQ
jgi:transcription elongation GreA/GreB family factor